MAPAAKLYVIKRGASAVAGLLPGRAPLFPIKPFVVGFRSAAQARYVMHVMHAELPPRLEVSPAKRAGMPVVSSGRLTFGKGPTACHEALRDGGFHLCTHTTYSLIREALLQRRVGIAVVDPFHGWEMTDERDDELSVSCLVLDASSVAACGPAFVGGLEAQFGPQK